MTALAARRWALIVAPLAAGRRLGGLVLISVAGWERFLVRRAR
jgi:hypothetical protein